MQGLRGGRRFSAIVNDFGIARLWTNAVRQGLMVASPIGGTLAGTMRLSRGGRKAHSRPLFDGIQS
jgi:hypothetical protein